MNIFLPFIFLSEKALAFDSRQIVLPEIVLLSNEQFHLKFKMKEPP